jgi:hypothetical protein
VIDDISPLRQISDSILKGDAYLFKPADATDVSPTDDNGTPLQKDEPEAPNPPDGVPIDFYVKGNPTGDVTLDIIDSSGAVIHTFTTKPPDPNAAPTRRGARRGGIPSVSPLWQTTPEPFSGSAGMHRVFWAPIIPPPPPPPGTPAGFGRGEGTRVSGTFTAKLTVNGKSYTQTFTLKPDPRLSRPVV